SPEQQKLEPQGLEIGEVLDRPKRPNLVNASVVYGLVFTAFAALILRLGYVQIAQGSYFRGQATATTLTHVPVLPARGWIYDTNGNLLAYDLPAYGVFLTQMPGTQQNYRQIANTLAPVFHVRAETIMNTLSTQNKYATIQLFKAATDEQIAFVAEHQSTLQGVNVVLNSQRFYPNGPLAGKVLGYVAPIPAGNTDYYQQRQYLLTQKVGVSGLESQYEGKLQGEVGEQVVQVDKTGTPLKPLGFNPAPQSGATLRLTLDGHLQAIAQQTMMNRVLDSKYRSTIQDAELVMLDVKTGGVLAMVNYPDYDPNWFTQNQVALHEQYLRQPAAQIISSIQSARPPGSTVKPVNLITALERGAITPQTTIFDHYSTVLAPGYTIHDDGSHGWVDPVKAITVSCDTFFYELGFWLGQWFGATATSSGAPPAGVGFQTWLNTDFAKGLNALFGGEYRFGLGAITGVDLPGEQPGSFYYFNLNMKDGNFYQTPYPLQQALSAIAHSGSYPLHSTQSTLANAGIGQSQAFTPLEMAQYVATIANNGKRLQPHLLQATYAPAMQGHLSADAKATWIFPPNVQADLKINPKYLHIAQQGMYGVCNNFQGTAYGSFANAPYRAAGKTGTAQLTQQIDNSVFIGYAPFDNPQVAIAVMVPGAGYGAETAVPIGRQMLDAYFQEHHEFFPKKMWTNGDIPSNWKQMTAYTYPEQSH
ncbi:peptidoglycan glycosyltransferase, partial [Alicyclobacillaceae bacterium I2511]